MEDKIAFLHRFVLSSFFLLTTALSHFCLICSVLESVLSIVAVALASLPEE